MWKYLYLPSLMVRGSGEGPKCSTRETRISCRKLIYLSLNWKQAGNTQENKGTKAGTIYKNKRTSKHQYIPNTRRSRTERVRGKGIYTQHRVRPVRLINSHRWERWHWLTPRQNESETHRDTDTNDIEIYQYMCIYIYGRGVKLIVQGPHTYI